MFIAIEGNMGSGKTTYAKALSNHFQAYCALEPGEKELLPLYPYLDSHSLRVQIYCLMHRLNSQKDIKTYRHKNGAVSDYVMAKDLVYAKLFLPKDDYNVYAGLFESLRDSFEPPDLLVLLDAPLDFLLERIRLRSIKYELSMDIARLRVIQEEMKEQISKFPARKTISLNVTEYDISKKYEDLERLVANINQFL